MIDSRAGCCGMAGSFGNEHGSLSRKVANDRLLPNLRAALHEHGEGLAVIASELSGYAELIVPSLGRRRTHLANERQHVLVEATVVSVALARIVE